MRAEQAAKKTVKPKPSVVRSLLAISLGAVSNVLCTHLFSYTLAISSLIVFQTTELAPKDLLTFFISSPIFLLTSTAAGGLASFIGGATCARLSGKSAEERQVIKNAALTAGLLLTGFIVRLAYTPTETLLESPAWYTIAPFVLEMPCGLLGARWVLNRRKTP